MAGETNNESMLEFVRPFGWYQLLILIYNQFALILVSTNMIFMSLGASQPTVPLEHDNFTDTANTSLTLSANCTTDSSPKFETLSIQYGLIEDRAYLVSWITSVQMIGVLFGAAIGGRLADLYGRKTISFASIGLLSAIGIGSGWAPEWYWYMLFRFAIGALSGSTITSAFILSSEQIVQRYRTLLFVGGWPTGSVVLAVVALLTSNWRALNLVINCIGVIPFVLLFILNESPKWLIENNRKLRATKVLCTIARWNGVCEQDRKHIHDMVDKYQTELGKEPLSYLSLLYNSTYRRYLLPLMFYWMSVAMVHYGLIFTLGAVVDSAAHNILIFACINVFASVFIPICDQQFAWLGRRWIALIGWGTFGVCLLAAIVIQQTGVQTSIGTWITCAGLGIGQLVWAAGELYTTELFPTNIRNTANGLCNSVARVGSITAPLLLLLNTHWLSTSSVIFCMISWINVLFVWNFLPETKGVASPQSV